MEQLSRNSLCKVANLIHHSCKDRESLIEDVVQLLQTSNDYMECLSEDNVALNKSSCTISPSSKENERKITGLNSRPGSTRENVCEFIRRNATQKPSKLWVLGEDIRKRLVIKDRVHPLFAGFTTQKSEKKVLQSPWSRRISSTASSNAPQNRAKSLKSDFLNTKHTPLYITKEFCLLTRGSEDKNEHTPKKTPSPTLNLDEIEIIEPTASTSISTPDTFSAPTTKQISTKSRIKRPNVTKISKLKLNRRQTNDTPKENTKPPTLVMYSLSSESETEKNKLDSIEANYNPTNGAYFSKIGFQSPYPESEFEEDEQVEGQEDEVVIQKLKFPNILVERIHASNNMAKTSDCTPTTSLLKSEERRKLRAKKSEKMKEKATSQKSNMSEPVKNETPSSAQSNCDVIEANKKRKFKGPAGRRIDSPAAHPNLFESSSDVIAVPNPIKKEQKKKKASRENEKPQLALKNRALTSFFSPLQNTSNMKKESVASLTEEERRTKLVMIYTNRVERALNTFDKTSLLKVIKEIVKLPEEDIEKIPNPFVKFVAKREFVHLRNIDAMKNMTNEAKKVYKKNNYLKVETNKEFEALILQFLSGRREDVLCELKPFYNVPLVKIGSHVVLNSNAACALFGHCLSLTEFLNTFRELLGHALFFSAEFLMDELKTGQSGFRKCTGYILKAFLHFLLADGYKKKCKQLQTFAPRTHVPGVNGIFKLTQLVLLDDAYSEESVDSEPNPREEEDIIKKRRSSIGCDADVDRALQQLEDVAFFWNLSISSQITIMEILMDKIIDSMSFRKYLDSSKDIRDRAMQEKKDIEDTMQKVQKDIEEIQSHSLEEDMSCLTRKQTREIAENEKLKNKKANELELLRDKLSEQDGHIQEAETISNYGQVTPLGYDRFYRRYWFFGNSPNRGIYVEQEAAYSTENSSEDKLPGSVTNACGPEVTNEKAGILQPKKNFTSFLTTLNENLFGRPPDDTVNQKAQWRVIRTEKEFNLLLECLGKGVREEKLAAGIRRQHDQILESLKENKEAEQMNNEIEPVIVSVDPLKLSSDAKAEEIVEAVEQKADSMSS